MRVLVTGGGGFVMSNVVRALLSRDDEARAVVLDLGGRDEAAAEFLAPFTHRIDWVGGDIREESVVERAFSFGEITHVVHGATLTHFGDWEREDPGRFMDVNVMGTIRLLERARRAAGLQRFVYVSSGAVYGEPVPGLPRGRSPSPAPSTCPRCTRYRSSPPKWSPGATESSSTWTWCGCASPGSSARWNAGPGRAA